MRRVNASMRSLSFSNRIRTRTKTPSSSFVDIHTATASPNWFLSQATADAPMENIVLLSRRKRMKENIVLLD